MTYTVHYQPPVFVLAVPQRASDESGCFFWWALYLLETRTFNPSAGGENHGTPGKVNCLHFYFCLYVFHFMFVIFPF